MVKTPFIYALVLVLLSTGGCTRPRKPGEVVYVAIPEGYLQSCELPAVPEETGGLSDAFAQAYLCGEQTRLRLCEALPGAKGCSNE